MKKVKAWSNLPLPFCAPAVWWVDCGAFLLWPGPSYGSCIQPNNPSLAFYKPDLNMNVKKFWKKDCLSFYLGVCKLKSCLLAIVGRAVAKFSPTANFFLRKKKADEESCHEKGFALMGLCILLPLILVLISVLMLSSFWLKNFWATQKICEEQSLQAQQQMAPLLSSLLKLNPEIIILRKEKIRTQAQLALAIGSGNAPAIAALRIKLQAIQLRLLAIFAQQNFLFQKAEMSRWKMVARFHNLTKMYTPSQVRRIFQFPLSLAVKPDSLSEKPPLYSLVEDFEKNQRLEVQWKQNLFQSSPVALQRILSLKILSMARSCSATLEKRNHGWHTRLIKVRDSLSFSY